MTMDEVILWSASIILEGVAAISFSASNPGTLPCTVGSEPERRKQHAQGYDRNYNVQGSGTDFIVCERVFKLCRLKYRIASLPYRKCYYGCVWSILLVKRGSHDV